jgi:hypothetical protein
VPGIDLKRIASFTGLATLFGILFAIVLVGPASASSDKQSNSASCSAPNSVSNATSCNDCSNGATCTGCTANAVCNGCSSNAACRPPARCTAARPCRLPAGYCRSPNGIVRCPVLAEPAQSESSYVCPQDGATPQWLHEDTSGDNGGTGGNTSAQQALDRGNWTPFWVPGNVAGGTNLGDGHLDCNRSAHTWDSNVRGGAGEQIPSPTAFLSPPGSSSLTIAGRYAEAA